MNICFMAIMLLTIVNIAEKYVIVDKNENTKQIYNHWKYYHWALTQGIMPLFYGVININTIF